MFNIRKIYETKRHGLSLQLIEVKLFISGDQDMEQDEWDKYIYIC